jgi:GTP pyrophosphokinase
MVPLAHKLQSGDIVEILTQKNAHPSLDWLNFIKTPSAKSRIKSFFRKLQRDEHIEMGKQELSKAVLAFELEPRDVLSEKYLKILLDRFHVNAEEELYIAIANGEVSARSAAQIVKDHHEKLFPKTTEWVDQIIHKLRSSKRRNPLGIEIQGMQDIEAHLAKCCRPLPGDPVVGFVTMGHGVSIHRSDCVNVTELVDDVSKHRVISARWLSSPKKESVYPVEIEVKGFDRVGLLNDILSKISHIKTNIREANVRTSKENGTVIASLVVDIHDAQHLSQLLSAIRSIDDVFDTQRVLS